MTFSQLTSGTRIHVLEITGTFKKNTTYSLGTVVSVSKPYDEPVPPTQFPMPMQKNRRKLVDLVISCDGEQRKNCQYLKIKKNNDDRFIHWSYYSHRKKSQNC